MPPETRNANNQCLQRILHVLRCHSFTLLRQILSAKQLTYDPLKKERKDFRLIDLHAGQGKDLLECSLRHVTLGAERPPEYETISYCWGKPKPRVLVKINGDLLSVPKSCDAALRRVRLPDRSRTLWIDAVCIDQSDRNERAHQVGMMGDVYRRSRGNLIYLGESHATTARAIQDIRRLVAEMHQDETELQELVNTRWVRVSDCRMQCAVNFEALEVFYSLAWFRRLWVFQEAALAPSNVCLIGALQTNLSDALSAAMWLLYKRLYVPESLGICAGSGHSNLLYDFVDKDNGWYNRDGKHDPYLADLLEFVQDLETSEDSDRIYGMLGLKEWPHGIPGLLMPNYEKPVNHVFRDATRYALQEDGNSLLWIWRYIRHQSNQEIESRHVLSWVPDWSRALDPDEDPCSFARIFRCGDGIDQTWETSSASDFDPDMLAVRGFELCKVSEVSLVLTYEIADDAGSLSTWLEKSMDLIQGNLQAENGVASILVGGANYEERKATEADLLAFEDFVRMFGEEHSRKDLQDIATLDNHEWNDCERAVGRYQSALRNACINRTVFRTASGYAGVGPKIMQQNDIVVVLYGGEYPSVLRPCSGEYKMLGECFVYGIMDGEATRKHREDGIPDKVFHLR